MYKGPCSFHMLMAFSGFELGLLISISGTCSVLHSG
jgi:hypothetical protein